MRTRQDSFASGIVPCVLGLLLALCGHCQCPWVFGAEQEDSLPITFEKSIQPILLKKCARCHGETVQKGELSFATAKSFRAGSETGPIFEAGKPAESRLIEVIERGEMPPDGKDSLTDDEAGLLKKWIEDGATFANNSDDQNRVTQHQVLPILYLRCTVCHGGRVQEAGLDLRTRASLIKGGKSGSVIVPGQPQESLLLKRIHAEEMPPRARLTEAMVKPLEAIEITRLTEWIEQGAPEIDTPEEPKHIDADPLVRPEDRRFWSFQPPKRPQVPQVTVGSTTLPASDGAGSIPHPVDAFVLAQLAKQGLGLSPAAEPLTLLRRATLDLTGLPPTVAEIQEFLDETNDASQGGLRGAYSRLIDRLLDSPRYGERWGRIWLDIAGYSDCEGRREQHLPRPFVWRYRDYVIRSLNADKPYDRFLLEQLAGDDLADYRNASEITQEIEDNLVATAFLRMAPDPTWANLTGFVPDRLEVMADSLDVLGSGIMGLSFKCARCHTHKFDPIPQRDYFRLVAIFKGAYDEHNWLKPERIGFGGALSASLSERSLPFVTTSERNQWMARTAELDRQIAELQKSPDSPDAKQKIQALQSQKSREPQIFALWDDGDPSPTYLYRRGDYLTPGPLVEPELPSALNYDNSRLNPQPPYPGAQSTGRRLAFARWLTRANNPLTARVLVNRIWFHHFGRGIVTSLGNFGAAGERPSHPELLDWLACEFTENKWSLKKLHRLLMTSATYQQSSLVSPVASERDPDNRWFSRMPLRRVDAEQLRDSLLFVAGTLDETRFGPPEPVQLRGDGAVLLGKRRSVYMQQLRKSPVTLLESFDLPQMNPNCLERKESLVAPQALQLLNDGSVRELATHVANRVWDDSMTSVQLLQKMSRQLLGRDLQSTELDACQNAFEALANEPLAPENLAMGKSARQLALQTIAHTLINSAAFLYID